MILMSLDDACQLSNNVGNLLKLRIGLSEPFSHVCIQLHKAFSKNLLKIHKLLLLQNSVQSNLY